MEAPSDPLDRLMQAFECSLCSHTFRDAVCFPTTCGHYFCRECVIATLEGPGISTSECPVCHKPGWKNDLKTSYTVNNALVHAAGLRAEVQRGREAERLRQRCGSNAQPTAAAVAPAAADPRPASAGPSAAAAAAARPVACGEAGGSTGKRKRRGRSVPEHQEGGRACAGEERHAQQTAQQQPAGQQQLQEGEGWRGRQQQSVWGRKKAAPPAAAAQAQQQEQHPQQQPAAAPMQPASAAAEVQEPDVELPQSPVPVLYDSDWEQQARAAPLGPATPEAIAALEAEVALLQQAIQLCDELPCLGGLRRQGHGEQQQQQQATAMAGRQAGESAGEDVPHAGAAGEAGAAADVQREQHAQLQPPAASGEGQEVVIVPDTEDGGLPSPPKPACAAAAASLGPAGTAEGGQAGAQQQQQLAVEEGQPAPLQQAQQQAQQHVARQQQRQQDEGQPAWRQQDRKRQLGELPAAQAYQQALQAGLTQAMDEEEGHRMSGRKRRKGGLGRAAPGSSRLGRPGGSAAATASTDANVDDVQQAAAPATQGQRQQAAAQQLARPSKVAVGEGDAVEVMWQVDEELVPYVGMVLEVLPGGKHRIEYLDGEVATQDLDEEQWRLLLQEEYEEAEAEYERQQLASGSPSQLSSGTSSSGEEFELSSGSEDALSGSQQSGGVGLVSSPAAPLPPPAAEPPAPPAASMPSRPEAAKAAGAPAAPAAAAPSAAPTAAAAAPAVAVTAPAVLPQLQAAAAAAVKPKAAPASSGADPYTFVSNTEAAGDEGQLFQAAPQRPQLVAQHAQQQQQHAQQHQQQQQQQQALKARQQPKQHAKPAAARKRPLVPPPKFNQEPSKQQLPQLPNATESQMPEWLQQAGAPHTKPAQHIGRQQAAEPAAQQHFGRKRKEAAGSLDSLPGSGREAGVGAASTATASRHSVQRDQLYPPAQQQQQQVRRPRLHDRPSMQQRRRRRAESEEEEEAAQQQAAAAATAAAADAGAAPPAADKLEAEAMDIVPSTQDAAGALFSMLTEQQQPAATAAAAQAGSSGMAALPLQPTSRHNAAAGEGGFVPASQLPLEGGWEGEAAVEQRQQQQPAAAGQRRTSGKVLQDPGLFGLPPAGHGSGRSKGALQDPGLFSQSSEGSGSHAKAAGAAAAAAAGAAAAEAGRAAPADSGPQEQPVGFADLFAGATASQAVWPSSSPEPEIEVEDSQDQDQAAAAAAAAAEAEAAAAEAHTPGGSRRRCIAVSGLTSEIQQKLLTLRARLGGLILEDQVTERTTHVLVPVDDRGCVKQRSMQYLLALAHGCWAVSHGWVDACLEAGQWLPERQYEARGLADMKGSMFVPAAARQRHAPDGSGGPGLFAGRRICLMTVPSSSGGGRVSAAGTASKVALVSQMVAAEGGAVVRAPGQGEGGGARGAASPSPSPEGATATLLVSVAQGPQEARAAVKAAQKRHPGRHLHHQSWLFDSLCCGRCLDPADYVMTEQRPLPTGARPSLSQQQPSQAAGASQA